MKANTSEAKTAVLINDHWAKKFIARNEPFDVYHQVEEKICLKYKSLLIFSSASKLTEVASLIKTANQHHYLKALLIRSDVNLQLLSHMMRRANVRSLRNMLVHSEDPTPKRVIEAWRNGAQNELIAFASVIDDSKNLLMINCSMERFEVPIAAFSALEGASKDELNNLIIDDDGSYVYWPKIDVHLNLDSIRYVIDPQWRTRKDIESFKAYENFGHAVAELRKEKGLRQSDIPDLSSRQVRRIEQGQFPSMKALKALSSAHSMSLSEYLGAISNILHTAS